VSVILQLTKKLSHFNLSYYTPQVNLLSIQEKEGDAEMICRR
jgi:hypothetical protein